MIQHDQWIRWEPISNLAEKYFVGNVDDNDQSLIFTLVNLYDNTIKTTVHFDKTAYAYATTSYPDLLTKVDKLAEQYGKEFIKQWSFFKVNHSTFIKTIHQQEPQIPNVDKWIHFVLVCTNSIIEVIAVNEPRVELIYTHFHMIGGKVRIIEGDQIAVARPASKDSNPTLEIYDPTTKERKKIRYNGKGKKS